MLTYFDESEFVMGGENVYRYMDPEFLFMLDDLRERVGFAMKITSSYRSPEYNAKVGGAKKSMHLRGRAVDIACRNSADRARIVYHALEMGFTCGIAKTFIHLDNRGEQKIFLY